ncbi:selenocysteine-specific translation elongation factor [Collibacillus ludicampi]|uniref:Selenocysteine-specific elongation factor n=1 Tax=Collibacillus ludicampi TaxID=2771369 RepID=A0AAV4LCA0_9BACL|nr:selenocysteine-specific translation elongation factor [Collibacillus ludicampi]GIM45289.1 selenocysteine-specific translation elongation factor [Collibacillus ludicampi]
MSKSDFFIVGTAGHIDHGKTALVKALTGKDTDIHKEEKERGISIDVGFAPLLLPDGRRIGIVDVPGHERFIKNMLAGAGGIDLILLVIAANEGVMPQTREHLHILEMLNVQKGIVVLTKIDTVDTEWLQMVTEEVREELKGSILKDAPLIPVSSHTGEGIERLRETIADMARVVVTREVTAPLRLPIDRIFSVPGFGTVVTGTIVAGRVSVGEHVELLPSGEKARVRSIQVHGDNVDSAVAGQRTALNLVGVERAGIHRGEVVVAPSIYKPTELIDARLRLLTDAPRGVTNRMRIRFYMGTSEAMARVIILDRDEIAPGEDALVQIELESPVVCEAKDRFIIRTYSPMMTLGGGMVIDPHPVRLYRRKRTSILEELAEKEKGGPHARIAAILQAEPGLTLQEIAARIKATPEQTQVWLQELAKRAVIEELPGTKGFIEREEKQRLFDEIEEKIRAQYAKSKYNMYVGKAQILSQLRTKIKPKIYDALIALGEKEGRFEIKADRIRLSGYQVPLSLAEKSLIERLRTTFLEHGFQPPSLLTLADQFKGKDQVVQGLLSYMKEREELIEIEEGIFFAKETIERAKEIVKTLADRGELTVAVFRDHVGTSRKFALALLEYFDRMKWTRREGEKRLWIAS